MEPESRNKGFAMLEVMMIIMIFMVLAASLFASAGAINRRTVSRAANNEAHYAALAAVKLMAGEVMNNENGGPSAIFQGTGSSGTLGLPVTETELVFNGEGNTQRSVPIKVSSKISLLNGKRYMTLTANATVGGQTENVSLTLQERTAYVPDYPYGCGVMGKLNFKQGSSLATGPDADVYLQGFAGEQLGVSEGITEIGGNLIVDGSMTEGGLKLQLNNVRIGGMLISNDDVSLVECAVGNEKEDAPLRKGGIYTTGNLSLTNCNVGGDIYANGFTANGFEIIDGFVNYITWNRKNYTVWGTVGPNKAVNTSDAEYRRNGEVQAAGMKKILNSTNLFDYVPKKEDVFVPETDGVTEKNGMKVIYLKKNDYKVLDELISQRGSGEENHITNIIIMEEGSRLSIFSGEWAAYIYGNGEVDINGVQDTNTMDMIPVHLYGGIQANQISLAANTELDVYHGEPADPAMKTPSSAVGFKGWSPLDYNMNPSSEEVGQ